MAPARGRLRPPGGAPGAGELLPLPARGLPRQARAQAQPPRSLRRIHDQAGRCSLPASAGGWLSPMWQPRPHSRRALQCRAKLRECGGAEPVSRRRGRIVNRAQVNTRGNCEPHRDLRRDIFACSHFSFKPPRYTSAFRLVYRLGKRMGDSKILKELLESQRRPAPLQRRLPGALQK